MRLLEITHQQWQILAHIEGTDADGNELCPTLDIIQSHIEADDQYASSANGLVAMLETCSKSDKGPRIFNSDQCHEADKAESIYEFIKGDLRLLWFYGKGKKIIVCSHVFVKKGQKTPSGEKAKVIKVKNQYLKAHAQKVIEVIKNGN